MTLNIIPLPENSPIMIVGKAANQAEAMKAFSNYRDRRAANTTRRQDADLELFADYLHAIGVRVANLATDPRAWQGITWGLVSNFVQWQLQEGYAVDSVNVRLSTIKIYASLALQAGTMTAETYAMIRTVKGYGYKEKVNIDGKRKAAGFETRRTTKARMIRKNNEPVSTHRKREPIFLNKTQRDGLLSDARTQQARRDNLLILLMLDHGLRISEVAGLQVSDFDLSSRLLKFYRPKTKQTDMHRLTDRTYAAVRDYLKIAPQDGCIWRASAMKNEGKRARGKLTAQGMSTNAIYKRVELAGRRIGIDGLSPHDLRHTFAERAKHSPTKILQSAGGWNSESMPLRYQKSGAIANEGLILEE